MNENEIKANSPVNWPWKKIQFGLLHRGLSKIFSYTFPHVKNQWNSNTDNLWFCLIAVNKMLEQFLSSFIAKQVTNKYHIFFCCYIKSHNSIINLAIHVFKNTNCLKINWQNLATNKYFRHCCIELYSRWWFEWYIFEIRSFMCHRYTFMIIAWCKMEAARTSELSISWRHSIYIILVLSSFYPTLTFFKALAIFNSNSRQPNNY